VQIAAAKALKNAHPSDVGGQVTGTVDATSGALTVTGTGSSPEEAQAVTTAFAQAFVDDAAQEAKKAELHKATEKAVQSLDAAYIQASSLMDAMVGVLGKDQPLSKQLRQIREQMVHETSRGKDDKPKS